MLLHISITLFIITLTLPPIDSLDTFNLEPNSALPYRPISTNRVGTISFTTNSAKVIKTFNLEAHTTYFKDIVGLWGSIFLEEQLVANHFTPAHAKAIDERNPECRDLRAIVMEELKSVSDLLHANVYLFNEYPVTLHKRSTRSTNSTPKILPKPRVPKTHPSQEFLPPLSPPTTTRKRRSKIISSATTAIILKKRSPILSSALTLFKAYMLKKGASHLASRLIPSFNFPSKTSLIPIGGDILSYVFGLTSRKTTELNRKLIHSLSNRMDKIGQNQLQLVQYANLTQILVTELSDLVAENDARITHLFNLSRAADAKQQRSITCLNLFAQSSHVIDAVKSSINEFILADTLLPQGNKKLFSEKELSLLLTTNPGYTLATGARNLWDYPIFSMDKNGMEWSYCVQVPLTNLPLFTSYKISPFPVFPKPNPDIAIQVEIDSDTNVILASNEKYFVDKIDQETCSFSGTHGVCTGPIGLIDIDFAPCSVCLLLHSPATLLQKCKFTAYTGTFPRIASSMGKFLLSSKDRHDFLRTCPQAQTSHLTTQPGSTSLELGSGCSLNTSDIKLILPLKHNVLHSQKIDNNLISVLRFDEPLPLNQAHLEKTPPETLQLKNQIKDIKKHQDKSPFNIHIRKYSLLYTPLLLILILLIVSATGLTHFRLSTITPRINTMQLLLQPQTKRVLMKRIRDQPAAI